MFSVFISCTIRKKGAWCNDKKWKNVYTAFYFVDIPVLGNFVENRGGRSGAGFTGSSTDGSIYWKGLI